MVKDLAGRVAGRLGGRWRERSVESVLYLVFWCVYAVPLVGLPRELFSALPATGGDTGSHLWPLVAFREYGFPHLDLRIWNPAHFTGEPLLVHYFPLPFILMAA